MISHRLMMGCGEVKSFVTGNKSGVLAAVLSMGGTAGEGLSVATGFAGKNNKGCCNKGCCWEEILISIIAK